MPVEELLSLHCAYNSTFGIEFAYCCIVLTHKSLPFVAAAPIQRFEVIEEAFKKQFGAAPDHFVRSPGAI